MRLLRATGRLDVQMPEGEEAHEALVAEARRILVAGVVRLSLSDWEALEPAERDAFVEAGERLAAERGAAPWVAGSALLGAAAEAADAEERSFEALDAAVDSAVVRIEKDARGIA